MTNDPVGDTLARIQNALLRSKDSVEVQNSKLVASVLEVLKNNRRIASYKANDKEGVIVVDLGDRSQLEPIKKLKRISKPGVRVYRGYRRIKPVLNGYGFAVISTPKGVMDDVNARKQKVGGEILCEVT